MGSKCVNNLFYYRASLDRATDAGRKGRKAVSRQLSGLSMARWPDHAMTQSLIHHS